jgi:RimJ/RimL family protein N-acetyltransferase
VRRSGAWCFCSVRNPRLLVAWVEPANGVSSRLLESCGYLYEGRLRSFLSFPSQRADALVLSRVLADVQVKPG